MLEAPAPILPPIPQAINQTGVMPDVWFVRPGITSNLLLLLLGLSLLAPLGISYYGFGNFGELISLSALATLSLLMFFQTSTSTQCRLLFLAIPLAVISLAVFYGLLFQSHTMNAEVLPSILSFRWNIYWMLAPCIQALAMRRINGTRIFVTCLAALFVVLAIYYYCQATWDLEAMAHEQFGQGKRISIRAPDAWRGYRLPDPQYALMMSLLFVLSGITLAHKKWRFFVVLLCVTPIFIISFQRVAIIYASMSWLSAVLLVLRADRTVRIFLGTITGLTATLMFGAIAGLFSNDLANYIAGDRSGAIRIQTLNTCLEQIAKYPIFGFGSDSAQGVSYQKLFGLMFFPADVGLVGLYFSYGLLGLAIYIAVTVLIVKNNVRHYQTNFMFNRSNTFARSLSFAGVWASLYFMFSGWSLQPFLSPDGIVSLALLAALPSIVWRGDVVRRRMPRRGILNRNVKTAEAS